METVTINVTRRDETGKGAARRLRRAGSLPAVVYGKGLETHAITIPLATVRGAFAGGDVILELEGEPELPRYAVLKQLQVHPVRHQWLHLDLEAVDLTEELETTLPVTLVGIPVGVTEGGMLDDLHHLVTVRALPSELPPALEVDVSGLTVGHNVTLADVVVPAGVTLVDEPETVLASVLAPTVEELVPEVEAEVEEPETVEEESAE